MVDADAVLGITAAGTVVGAACERDRANGDDRGDLGEAPEPGPLETGSAHQHASCCLGWTDQAQLSGQSKERLNDR